MGKLSDDLLELGFSLVLDRLEYPGGRKEGTKVSCGTAKTFDHNNGVTVVYDQEGRPWVIQGKRLVYGTMDRLRRYHSLQHGAYVPFSNGGRWF